MAVEVEDQDDAKGRLPAQAEAAHNVHHAGREPGDEAKLVEVGGHGNKGGEPGQGVPCSVVVQALLPGDDALGWKQSSEGARLCVEEGCTVDGYAEHSTQGSGP